VYGRDFEKGNADVLETPQERLIIEEETKQWSYGTVGTGIDLPQMVWPNMSHEFSSRLRDLSGSLPGMPKAKLELGPAQKVRHNVLDEHPVEILLLDGIAEEIWTPWVTKCDPSHRPQAIVWCGPVDFIVDETAGPAHKSFRKKMARAGYEVTYWTMAAENYGAALAQDRLVVVCTLGKSKDGPLEPIGDDVPPRSMSNLLMPTGVPHKAWYQGQTQRAVESERWWPCEVNRRTRKREPIYDHHGLMPDQPGCWINSERGVRRLQSQELAKAKGVPSEWITGGSGSSRPLKSVDVGLCTGIHIWTAVMDSTLEWLTRKSVWLKWMATQDPSPDPPLTSADADGLPRNEDDVTTPEASVPPSVPSPAPSPPLEDPALDEEWKWEVPDLQPGSSWYCERVVSLKNAVQGLPEATRFYDEGIEALRVHRTNYTTSGPQRLQLLWWEFPPEHWEALREGSSMNFLITPEGELELNADMDAEDRAIAGRFVDELIKLGVLLRAVGRLRANCPLFCVDKPSQPDEKRCIADCKRGGQNKCTGKDPVYLVRSEDILPHLYEGGWSAIADASKHFHNFKVRPEDRAYLGCIHPITGEEFVYAGLPMGAANSPAIACRIGNSSLRQLRENSDTFSGEIRENTWRAQLDGEKIEPRWGHGRVEIGPDGLPIALVWGMVDDFLIHAPTKGKCFKAFSEFMDHTVRLGFICQKAKTSPPAQEQKFCGMLYDTNKVPCIRVIKSKVSRSTATINYAIRESQRGNLSRLTLAVTTGLLQSLVDATPQRIGQTYLRELYNEVHELDMWGKALYYTDVILSAKALADLEWWLAFLRLNCGNQSRTATSGSLSVTFGDGSGTGTGGTLEALSHNGSSLPELEPWMGVWAPHVHVFDSNWKEARTLLWTLERLYNGPNREQVRGATLFYFTDNLVTYYVVQNGSSSSDKLHHLVRGLKRMELLLQCRVEVIHVPGTLMIIQGTDGLSRGLAMAQTRHPLSSVAIAAQVLNAVPFSPQLGVWLLAQIGLPSWHQYTHFDTTSKWTFDHIFGQLSIWTPSPETARQALRTFLDIWVEGATTTSAIFVIPRVMQRDWGFLSKHVQELALVYPHELPPSCAIVSHVPFIVLHVPPYVRSLPTPDSLGEPPHPTVFPRWHQQQANYVRGL
jgi:hypothetical protein